MEGYCSTGQSPQWTVVPMEEEEEVCHIKLQTYRSKCTLHLSNCQGRTCLPESKVNIICLSLSRSYR